VQQEQGGQAGARAAVAGYAVRVARSFQEVEALRPLWTRLQSHPNSDIDNYLTVLRAGIGIRPHVLVAYRDGSPEAVLVGRLEERPVELKLGYLSLASPRVGSLTFIYGGVLGTLSPAGGDALAGAIFDSLRRAEAQVAYFNYLRTDTPLYESVARAWRFPSRDCFPELRTHRTMVVPGSAEAFYRRLSPKVRKNQKWQAKRLVKEYSDSVGIECFRQLSELDRMIAEVEGIASKTYQRGLGGGFADSSETRQRLKDQSGRGCLRSFVLHVGQRPVAFWMGTLYGRTFHSDYMGYDSEFARYSPGMFLIMKVIEGFCEHQNDVVESIDFGPGDAQYKQVLGDQEWQDASFYLFAPTALGLGLTLLRTPVAALDRVARGTAERAKRLLNIKKAWRRHVRPKEAATARRA
jgi:Acetyltransferase (GNAT) domain